jgi:hypothetical protein
MTRDIIRTLTRSDGCLCLHLQLPLLAEFVNRVVADVEDLLRFFALLQYPFVVLTLDPVPKIIPQLPSN